MFERWIIRLFSLLSDQRGDNTSPTIVVDESVATGEEDYSESSEGEEDETGEDQDTDAGVGSGKKDGKDRSETIPRERFDEVNAKAKEAERLVELGILVRGENGELHVNPEHLKAGKPKEGSEAEGDDVNFRFTKEDVDEDSWPLVKKINKGFDHFEGLAQKMAYVLGQLQSENAILRDYPEFLQRESPLRKKALEIMKSDPEFRKTYRGKPDAGYWAVKRASELLKGNQPVKTNKGKPKSKFITAKSDAGKTGAKTVELSQLSEKDLDDLERKEHERLASKK